MQHGSLESCADFSFIDFLFPATTLFISGGPAMASASDLGLGGLKFSRSDRFISPKSCAPRSFVA
jgi:hypothetical protein